MRPDRFDMLLVGAAVGFLAGVPLGHGVWLAVRWLWRGKRQ